jgi:hypothetical protein
MNFSSASKVSATIQATDDAARDRGENRNRIYNLFNGAPLVSEQDAKKLNLRVNCNWGEAAVLGQHGRRQYTNAFLSRGRFFKISIPDAPTEKQLAWSTFITRKINKVLTDSEEYMDLHEQQWASVLLQGIGIKLYESDDAWLPSYIAIEDLRVPTDTKCSLENLSWFAVRKAYTEGELSKKVFGKNSMPGWNKPEIQKILHAYHDSNTQDVTYDWNSEPEKMAELVKQNGGFYSSDAVPTIPLWHFYFYDDSKPKDCKWKLRVVSDMNTRGAPSSDKFLFDNGDKAIAKDRKHLLHIQYGDLNSKAPFLYHSVRSLGFLLMDPCFYTNLIRCRMVQHLHENMNIWLKSDDPAGRARAQKVELFDRCFIPPGVSVVPQTERHQMDASLAEYIMGDLKQLQKEASVSYTQDTEGQQQDETATSVMARVSSVNAMMSGLLSKAFRKEKFSYKEIGRRFCLSKSSDRDVIKFQKDCKEFGIPRVILNVEYWDVEPEVPMGAGNPTMETAKVQQLLSMRPMYDATAQQEILHEATVVITEDPRKAERWVPVDKERGLTDAQEHAEVAFAILMQGVPIRDRPGLNPMEIIETMLGLMAGVISRIEKTGGIATDGEIAGLQSVEQHIGQLINQMAQDKAEKARVKEYSDALGKLVNAIKGFAQRLQEQKQKQNGNGDGGKTQAMLIAAQTKAQITEKKSSQQQRHKETAFHMEQRRKDAEAYAEIQREHVKAVKRPSAFEPE